MTLQVGQIVRFNARGDPSHGFVARDPADAADALTTAIDWLFGLHRAGGDAVAAGTDLRNGNRRCSVIGADILQQLFAVPHQEQQGKPNPPHQDSCQLQGVGLKSGAGARSSHLAPAS